MSSKFFAILECALWQRDEMTMASDLPLLSTAVQELIQAMGLQAHPEGGFYKETWRSNIILPQGVLPEGYEGDRSAGTSILFLLPTGHSSCWHRVKSAEIWFHQAGDPLELEVAEDLEQQAASIFLGRDFCFQSIVPPNWWQRAQPVAGSAGYSLVGCVVVPGFDFADFEIYRSARHQQNPQCHYWPDLADRSYSHPVAHESGHPKLPQPEHQPTEFLAT